MSQVRLDFDYLIALRLLAYALDRGEGTEQAGRVAPEEYAHHVFRQTKGRAEVRAGEPHGDGARVAGG